MQADSLFEGLEKVVFGLPRPIHSSLNARGASRAAFLRRLGRLPPVATADDLDASTLERVEEDFQSGAGHCADLVPDDGDHDVLPPSVFGVE